VFKYIEHTAPKIIFEMNAGTSY